MSLAWIPKGILEKNRKLCSKILWAGTKEKVVFPLVKCSTLSIPKYLGGWGLKNVFLFSKDMDANSVWRLISKDNLWTQVVTHKYIRPSSLQEWIRSPSKMHHVASIIWKYLVSSFDVIGDGLEWHIGKGNKFHLGRDH
jgi:hypothetical protein